MVEPVETTARPVDCWKNSTPTSPSSSASAGSSMESAIAWLKASRAAAGIDAPPVDSVGWNFRPSAAIRESISTAMAAEPSTAPTCRVAL